MILDGKVMHGELEKAQLGEGWLRTELEKRGVKDPGSPNCHAKYHGTALCAAERGCPASKAVRKTVKLWAVMFLVMVLIVAGGLYLENTILKPPIRSPAP